MFVSGSVDAAASFYTIVIRRCRLCCDNVSTPISNQQSARVPDVLRMPLPGFDTERKGVDSTYNRARQSAPIQSTHVATSNSLPVPEIEEMSLDQLSERIQISKQTLVRWVDRHLIDADLSWTLSNSNEEIRVIELSEDTLKFLNSFSEDYRGDTVTRTEARRILKKIDRKKIKKMIRAGDILAVEVDDEVKIVVGSIEDYLISQENGEADED